MTLFEIKMLPVIGLVISSVLIFAGCDSSESDVDTGMTEIEWNYASKGPNVWASLSANFTTCSTGSSQSPIDISLDPEDDLPIWSFAYVTSPLDMVLHDHHIQLNIRSGSSITVGGIRHSLKYLKFKTPGEHSVQGATRAAEVHLYHESTDGSIAIVAVTVTVGAVNTGLLQLLPLMPVVPDEAVVDPTVLIRPLDFIPDVHTFYRYDGSLSEPPCTEGVKWIVMKEAIEFSGSQIEILTRFTGDNIRPVQPLNGRSITHEK